jgi:hypothetical protein
MERCPFEGVEKSAGNFAAVFGKYVSGTPRDD